MQCRKQNLQLLTINKYFILTICASVSFPAAFTFLYDSNFDSIICSFIHAFFSAILAYRVISESIINKNKINTSIVFILINIFYLSVSSVKYFSNELYVGFETNNWIRLAFTLAAAFVIWIAFEFVNNQQRTYSVNHFQLHNPFLLKKLTLLILVYIAYSTWETYSSGAIFEFYTSEELRNIGMEQSAMSLITKMRSWLNDISINILPILIALSFKTKGYRLFMISGFIVAFLYAIVFASRAALFYYYFGFVISLFYLHRIGKQFLVLPILLAPLVIAISSVTLMPLTKKMDVLDKEVIMRQLTYRFDLTDFAATLILKNDLNFNYKLIADAVIISIPKTLYQEKYASLHNAYYSNLEETDLNPDLDYTDTIFSTGSQLFGIIGFIIVPFLMVALIYQLEKWIRSLFGNATNIVVISCFPLYLRVENNLSGFLTDWRTLPLFILIGLALYILFIRPKKLFNNALTAR